MNDGLFHRRAPEGDGEGGCVRCFPRRFGEEVDDIASSSALRWRLSDRGVSGVNPKWVLAIIVNPLNSYPCAVIQEA